MLTVHMIGNAHLDPVWLWRWQQGADEALATFRSAADRCARIRLEGWLGHSRVRWTLSLLRYEPRLFIELDVHFCDHLKLLQMPVHLAETPLTWRDGQAMGAVGRRMHVTDKPVEWPVQGWSKMTLSQEHE